MKRKLCFVTGARSDYGLLLPVIRRVKETGGAIVQVVATASHLLPEFGYTWQQIEADGIPIDRRVEIPTPGDSALGHAAAMGRMVSGLAEAYGTLSPDLVVVLGDRYETLAAATAALVMAIPVAHLDGGELSEGAVDDSIRHAVTKLSHLHLTTAEPHRRRVIQLGEDPARVFVVGSTAIDNAISLPPMGRQQLEEALGLTFLRRNLLVTYYPETLSDEPVTRQVRELLAALASLSETLVVFTKPVAERGSQAVGEMIEAYVRQHPSSSRLFVSLGTRLYLSLLRVVDGVVGNSSSGIAEAPSFRVGTVNIGTRQQGRLRGTSVIDCEADRTAIRNAIDRLYSEEFRKTVATAQNPYGNGTAAQRIADVLTGFPLRNIRQKRFFDCISTLPADSCPER